MSRMSTKQRRAAARRNAALQPHVLVVKSYKNYGKGYPGWNASIKIVPPAGYSGNPTTPQYIAWASWPNVHGPQNIGFADLDAACQADSDLPEGRVPLRKVLRYLAPIPNWRKTEKGLVRPSYIRLI